MECIEARALKPSLLSESTIKPSQQVFFDDSFCFNGINGVSGEEFSVDVFLDLSNHDTKDGFVGEDSEEEEKDFDQNRVGDKNPNSRTFSGAGEPGFLATGELALPDNLEDLEWLSQFVDDSVSEMSLLCPAGGNFKEKSGGSSGNRCEPPCESAQKRSPFPSPVPAKARSKRARPSGRVWSLGSPPASESSSSPPSSSSLSSPAVFIFTSAVQTVGRALKPPAKRPKKGQAAAATGGETQRRCGHCQAQKTPQWRTGPLGPKTLCNACGVRYKSGRLFPEYRPACSPTFSRDLHSNNHRKVLEMRRQKESPSPEESPVF